VIAVVKPNLSDTESRELEEPLTEYGDIFAIGSDAYRRTDRVYHRIDTGKVRPICHPPRRLSVAKQADVGEMRHATTWSYVECIWKLHTVLFNLENEIEISRSL
jgi:hypothetical protein